MKYSLFAAAALATSVIAAPSLAERQITCESQANACRTAPGANQATCSAQYAACLGYNPYTAGVTSTGYHNGTVYATTVVNALTIACPSATILTVNSKTYTVTAPTTLTITDCPCTVTAPVTATATATTAPVVVVPPPATTASATKAVYTGGADVTKPMVGLFALGALALL